MASDSLPSARRPIYGRCGSQTPQYSTAPRRPPASGGGPQPSGPWRWEAGERARSTGRPWLSRAQPIYWRSCAHGRLSVARALVQASCARLHGSGGRCRADRTPGAKRASVAIIPRGRILKTARVPAHGVREKVMCADVVNLDIHTAIYRTRRGVEMRAMGHMCNTNVQIRPRGGAAMLCAGRRPRAFCGRVYIIQKSKFEPPGKRRKTGFQPLSKRMR